MRISESLLILVLNADIFMVTTISHVGHYPDLVSIAVYVIVDGLDQSVLEDIVYDFPQYEPDVYKYLPLIPKAHSTPHDRMHELVHAIKGLDLDLLERLLLSMDWN